MPSKLKTIPQSISVMLENTDTSSWSCMVWSVFRIYDRQHWGNERGGSRAGSGHMSNLERAKHQVTCHMSIMVGTLDYVIIQFSYIVQHQFLIAHLEHLEHLENFLMNDMQKLTIRSSSKLHFTSGSAIESNILTPSRVFSYRSIFRESCTYPHAPCVLSHWQSTVDSILNRRNIKKRYFLWRSTLKHRYLSPNRERWALAFHFYKFHHDHTHVPIALWIMIILIQ